MLKTSIVHNADEFEIKGNYNVAAKMANSEGWFGSAGAEVEYSVQLTLEFPANVIVSNCELFEIGGTLEETSRSGGKCEFSGLLDAEMLEIMEEVDYASILGDEQAQMYQDAVGQIAAQHFLLALAGQRHHFQIKQPAAVAQVQPVAHPNLFPGPGRRAVEQNHAPGAGRIGQGPAFDQPAALEVKIESKFVH